MASYMQMACKAVHITCSLFRYVTSTSRPARPVAELAGVEPVGDAPEAKHADRRRQRRIQARHNVRVQAHLQTDHLMHLSARCLTQRRGNTQMTNKMHCGVFGSAQQCCSSTVRQMLLALDRDEDTIINSFVWRHVRHGQSVIGWMVKHLANGRDALVGARRPVPGHLQQGRAPS